MLCRNLTKCSSCSVLHCTCDNTWKSLDTYMHAHNWETFTNHCIPVESQLNLKSTNLGARCSQYFSDWWTIQVMRMCCLEHHAQHCTCPTNQTQAFTWRARQIECKHSKRYLCASMYEYMSICSCMYVCVSQQSSHLTIHVCIRCKYLQKHCIHMSIQCYTLCDSNVWTCACILNQPIKQWTEPTNQTMESINQSIYGINQPSKLWNQSTNQTMDWIIQWSYAVQQ